MGGGALATSSLMGFSVPENQQTKRIKREESDQKLTADVVIIGAGLGGCAAAFSALRNNLTVVLTEETDWVGGQLTQQGVPPDEHMWIETHGAPQLYRDFRTAIRAYYKKNYPLTEQAKAVQYLNPGSGSVSKLCHEPQVAVSVLMEMMAPYISAQKLVLLTEHKVVNAAVEKDEVRSVNVKNLRNKQTVTLAGSYFVLRKQNQLLRTYIRCHHLHKHAYSHLGFVTELGHRSGTRIEVLNSLSLLCERIVLFIIRTDSCSEVAVKLRGAMCFNPHVLVGWNALLRKLSAYPIGLFGKHYRKVVA
jgi:monoamine oxidase